MQLIDLESNPHDNLICCRLATISSSGILSRGRLQGGETGGELGWTGRPGGGADLSMHGHDGGGLPHVAHVHRDLEALVEGFGVEQQHDLGLKLPADGGVHLWADHHHALGGEGGGGGPHTWKDSQSNRRTDRFSSQ